MPPRGKRILLFIFILALALFFYGAFGSNTLLLSLEGDAITLTGPEDSSFSVPYAGIASMELLESFDPGLAVEGGLKNHIRYGLWHNEALGDYRLFASDKIDAVILLRTTSGEALVFNYESADSTLNFYDTYPAFLAGQGYPIQTA